MLLDSMQGEEVQKLIETILSDKFEKINDRLNTIEAQVKNLQEELVTFKEGVSKQTSEQISEFTKYKFHYQALQDQVQEQKEKILKIETKTDNKLIEIEKIKLNQELSLQNLSRQNSIQTEVLAIQLRLQNIVQIAQSNQISTQEPSTQILSQPNVQIIQREQVTQERQVFKTMTGKKYHRDGCEWLQKSKIPISVDQARREGLQPCYVCNP